MAENEKCPRCGALKTAEDDQSVWFGCYSRLDKTSGGFNETVGCLRRQLTAAQAVIDKLPRYADTGQPFVPGVDGAWFLCDGLVVPATTFQRYSNGQYRFDGTAEDGQWCHTALPPYPTQAAALAAKEAAK